MGSRYSDWDANEYCMGVRTFTEHDKPHRETLIEFGPWLLGSTDIILKAFLREKGCKALIDLSEEQIIRVFGYRKHEVIGMFLAGYAHVEFLAIAMVLIACKLRRRHGDLAELRYFNNPELTELVYGDGYSIPITKYSGNPDITMVMMKRSYLRNFGAYCSYAFLNEAGFDISGCPDDATTAMMKSIYGESGALQEWPLDRVFGRLDEASAMPPPFSLHKSEANMGQQF